MSLFVMIPKTEFHLAPRLYRAAELAAEGLSNREIAEAMNLSVNTIKQYIHETNQLLGTHNRTQIAAWFWQQKIGAA